MAPSTPPPPSIRSLAAFTIASTRCSVMSPRTMRKRCMAGRLPARWSKPPADGGRYADEAPLVRGRAGTVRKVDEQIGTESQEEVGCGMQKKRHVELGVDRRLLHFGGPIHLDRSARDTDSIAVSRSAERIVDFPGINGRDRPKRNQVTDRNVVPEAKVEAVRDGCRLRLDGRDDVAVPKEDRAAQREVLFDEIVAGRLDADRRRRRRTRVVVEGAEARAEGTGHDPFATVSELRRDS